jgi:3-dehydroquinate synthase
MKTIRVELVDRAYPVHLGEGLLGDRELWGNYLGEGKTLVVSNETVAPLYLDRLAEALEDREYAVHLLPDGEQYKTIDTWRGILDCLLDLQARRDASVIALGGGVVGDISGFAAAAYMRGIRFLQAPTTLLAQVDASVGGKTGVNHPLGKNLIGAFHQPTMVAIDTATLDTLPRREFNAGLAEVVKYGAINDPGFFEWLEAHCDEILARDAEALEYLINRCVVDKADIVARDEKEGGIRALLNLGHSFGHALERETAYAEFLHGEAVAIGMVTAARLSENRKLCPSGVADRLASLLERFGLPVRIPDSAAVEGLAKALVLDKKAIESGLRLILLTGLGRAVIDQGSGEDEILAAMRDNQA